MRTVFIVVLAAVLASAATATADHLITGDRIAKSTITHRHIDNGSLGGWDIRDRSIASRDLREGAIEAESLDEATVAQLQSTPVTSVESTEVVAQSPVARTLQAGCPTGQVATGGGGDVVGDPEGGSLKFSRPMINAEGIPVGWEARVVFSEAGAPTATLRAFALCTPSA